MFQHKTVIITGAAQGIGKAIAMHFAEQHANIVIADLQQEGVLLAKELVAAGYSAIFIKTDVRSEDSVKQLMQQAQQHFGAIDILINNAGKFKVVCPLELSIDDWDDLMNTNVRSVFLCAREAAQYMPRGSSIINMASTRAAMSEPHTEGYAASKGAIVSLTHALASSFSAHGLTVNCIAPGWIETGDYEALRDIDHAQHFSGRVGTPDDIARACLYLADPRNHFINGTCLTIDGGMTKKMIYAE